MKAAQAEMDAMRLQLDRSAGQCKAATAEGAACKEREQGLINRCAVLEKSLADKEAYLVDMEEEIEGLKAEGGAGAGAALAVAVTERDAAVAQVQAAAAEVKTLRETLEQTVAVKDQRIAHLEASKLTQEQMDKIKLLKEEHKKGREDVKTMKKQLAQLKKAYDELKEKADKADNGPGEAGSLAEVSAKLEGALGVVKALKEKLRDCSKQLQEYERERGGVIRVLETHGVDTAGLQLQDTSLPEDASVLEQVGMVEGSALHCHSATVLF
jgi:chromosome segregation ATPase